jgi:peroxiredoxin Q/BCP/serine/threonine-protein kinase
LRRDFSKIQEVGAGLVSVFPQKVRAVATYLRKHPTPFPLVADADRSICRAWGVYHPLGLDAFRIARPASFVVGPDGKLSFVFVSSSQFRHVEVDDLVRELAAARGA